MQKNTSNSVKFQWLRKTVSAIEWKKNYADSNYCILSIHKDGASVKEIEFAYMHTEYAEPTLDLSCDEKDLEKIRLFLEAKNSYPRPNKVSENSQEEIKVAELF